MEVLNAEQLSKCLIMRRSSMELTPESKTGQTYPERRVCESIGVCKDESSCQLESSSNCEETSASKIYNKEACNSELENSAHCEGSHTPVLRNGYNRKEESELEPFEEQSPNLMHPCQASREASSLGASGRTPSSSSISLRKMMEEGDLENEKDRALSSSSSFRSMDDTDQASVCSTSYHSADDRSPSPAEDTNTFWRWKRHLQRAWKWGPNTTQHSKSFNPEILANQKRQWYQLHSQSPKHNLYKEPNALFEHFVIVGLHSNANLEATEDAFAKKKMWESEMTKSDILDMRKLQHRAPPVPTFEPQVLFKYPPGRKLAMKAKDLAAFCFPGGVKAWLMERTPSMSDLNEVVYGQEHLARDDLSFVFSLKVADNATLYGVCLHVQEIVQRPPGMLGAVSPLSQTTGCSRYLVSAPRCYCLLTRVPFFELHYEMLNSIIAQERLDRITEFVNEMTVTNCVSQTVRAQGADRNSESQTEDDMSGWTSCAIPVDSVLGLTAAAAGLIPEDEVHSFSSRKPEPQTPESLSITEASNTFQTTKCSKGAKHNIQYSDGFTSEKSDACCGSNERLNGKYENGQVSPTSAMVNCSGEQHMERIGSSDSLVSSMRSTCSEEDVEEITPGNIKNEGDEAVAEWAKVQRNDLLQIVCAYHSLPLPSRGAEIVFHPLVHLQPIKYNRPDLSALDIHIKYSDLILADALEVAKFEASLAAAEEALSLSVWTIATACRALSLECLLALLTGALLEKQVVIICSNLGVLSATVLSIVPMIRPFQWQTLLLPVLPRNMLEFVDAPVPYIIGIQHKPAAMKTKGPNIIRIDVSKNQVKMGSLPQLPRQKELLSEIGPIHAKLSVENNIAKRHPVYKCNFAQAAATVEFLNIMRRYLESLCSNLPYYTITSVQSNNDRVSLLLKDSFVDSFPVRDRAFIKLLVDTQLFTVLSDSRLSTYENGIP